MIILNFGKWTSKAGYLFKYDRVFTNTMRATPIVIMKFRHIGGFHQ